MVCAAGVAGWWLSRGVQGGGEGGAEEEGEDDALRMDLWGQIFGWLCAVLYLGSRLPQLLLNFRRKSTEGVSMLFFLFACLGNLTYVLSILAYEPRCGGPACLYGRYVLVNLSWLAGSAGTLLLDLGIFVQFFMYDNNHKGRGEEEEYGEEGATEFGDEEEEDRQGNNRWDQRPVLQRNDSR